jgi:DNA-binding MarR family transcriptional regulator
MILSRELDFSCVGGVTIENYVEKIYVLVHRCHEQCIKLIHANADGKMNGFDIGLKQGIVLKMLLRDNCLTQREITSRLQTTSSSCGELIAKLAQGGYVERRANAADKRTFDVSLTDSGRVLGEQYRDKNRDVLEEWGGNLSQAEKEQLFALLTKLSAGLDTQIEKQAKSKRGERL